MRAGVLEITSRAADGSLKHDALLIGGSLPHGELWLELLLLHQPGAYEIICLRLQLQQLQLKERQECRATTAAQSLLQCLCPHFIFLLKLPSLLLLLLLLL